MKWRLLCGGLCLAGCAHLPDGRTAVEHEQEAERRRMEVEAARAAIRVQETTRPVPSGAEAESDPGAPLAGYAAGRAAYEMQTALAHEKVARKIRENAEIACARVPPSMRQSCPLGGEIVKVEPMKLGARLHLRGSADVEGLRAQVACAVAQAWVDRPPDAGRCPLLVPTAESHVVDRKEGTYLEITAATEANAKEVLRRAEQLRAPNVR